MCGFLLIDSVEGFLLIDSVEGFCPWFGVVIAKGDHSDDFMT